MQLRPNQIIPLKIQRLGINGEGIGNFKGQTVFVPGALKGEQVKAKITYLAPRYAKSELVSIDKKAKNRVRPTCQHYAQCGGCQLMHLSYDSQLTFKRDLLKQALNKFKPSGYEDYELRATLGMAEPYHYRNKLQFQTRYKGRLMAGLYAPDSHRLVDIIDCQVQDATTQTIINRLKDLLASFKVSIYQEKQHKGALRTVMIRKSKASQQVQVIFITTTREVKGLNQVISRLVRYHPEIKGVAQNINPKRTSEIYGDTMYTLWGDPVIQESVLDLDFKLSPRAFYQLNPLQTSVLYQEVHRALELTPEDHLIDAYCGVGTIGLSFAHQVASVRGMDVIESAIQDAKHNAKAMGFENTLYVTGAAEQVIPKWYQAGYRATACVVDPPRTGLDSALLDTLVTYLPPKLVYVSCNVSTLARDLKVLAKYYQVCYIQSVDMFPHTARTEAVVKLEVKSDGA